MDFIYNVTGSSGIAKHASGHVGGSMQQAEQQEPATASGRGGRQGFPSLEEEPAEQRQFAAA